MNNIINEKTSRRFILTNDIIQFNRVTDELSQENWLIALKAVNIVKSNLIHWRNILFSVEQYIVDKDSWVDNIIKKAEEDLAIFLEAVIKNSGPAQTEKYFLLPAAELEPGQEEDS